MMSLKAPLHTALLEQNRGIIHNLVAAWAFGTGIAMVFDWRAISMEPAWKPAQFGTPHVLIFYGALYLLCCPLIIVAQHRPNWWKAGIAGAAIAGFLSLFFSFTLIIEALRSKQGWLGALNYVFIAVILGLMIRASLREHATGGQ